MLIRAILKKFQSESERVMQDETIIDMYFQRDEKAIEETAAKYGEYLFKIAHNILADDEDSKESLNDIYMKAWNSIPPARPQNLRVYLSRFARQISIDMFRKKNRKKRVLSQYAVSLSELEECISKGDETTYEIDCGLLTSAINGWLRAQPEESRVIFIGRYYFMDSVKDLSEYYGMSQAKVKTLLFRSRVSLREYLIKEGFYL